MSMRLFSSVTNPPSQSSNGREQLLYDIVVSSDNNDYLAWQCMLFHHSCTSHLGQAPIIVVHGDNGPLAQGYRLLLQKGGIVQRLPSMASIGSIGYAPRNMWATLKGVETSAENIVFCDPDFIFLRPIDFASIVAQLDGKAISLDQVGYMTVGNHNRLILETVCKRAWISFKNLDDLTVSGGSPLIVPTKLRRRLAREWANLTEDYLTTSFQHYGAVNSEVWIAAMWGLVLAAFRIDAPIMLTSMCTANQAGAILDLNNCGIVHYCYGDEVFDKRRFSNTEASLKTVWKMQAPEGTVNGVLAKALREAAEFYELA
jgi:hypothetical protein